MFVPIFAGKKGKREARIRLFKKNGYFSGMSPRNLEKGKIVHVFISIYSFRMFEFLCINVFEF